MATKKVVVATKKKAVVKKKQEADVIFKDSAYFTALMGRNKRKIRGQIDLVRDDDFWGQTWRLCGKDFEYSEHDVEDSLGFPKSLEIEIDPESKPSLELKKEGITEFKIVNDKRQIAIINGDKCPTFHSYAVRKQGNELVFGCGDVTLPMNNANHIKAIVEIGENSKATLSGMENILDSTREISVSELRLAADIKEYMNAQKGYSMRVLIDDLCDISSNMALSILRSDDIETLLAYFSEK